MAERRLFTKKIVESDAFIEMPLSAQCLYFHLNMAADDDGFVSSPRRIMRELGASNDDAKLLINKKFIIAFESGIVVIKHWLMHNTIRKDRYTETDYQEEKSMLFIKPNGVYTLDATQGKPLLATKWQPNGNQMATEDKISKDKISKDKISEYECTHTHVDTREDVENVDFINNIPTLEEIQEFITLKNFVNVDAQRFKDYYDSVGWRKGNTPITNWQALVGMWEREGFKQNGLVKPAVVPKRDYEERPKSEQHNESVEVDLDLSLEELEDLL